MTSADRYFRRQSEAKFGPPYTIEIHPRESRVISPSGEWVATYPTYAEARAAYPHSEAADYTMRFGHNPA